MHTYFTRYLRAYRMVRGISVTAAAAEAGISLSTWTQYESGSGMGPKGISQLAELFGCDEEKLTRMAQKPCAEDAFETVAKDAVEHLFSTL